MGYGGGGGGCSVTMQVCVINDDLPILRRTCEPLSLLVLPPSLFLLPSCIDVSLLQRASNYHTQHTQGTLCKKDSSFEMS